MRVQHPRAVRALIPVQVTLSALSIPSGVLLVISPRGEAIGAQTILPHLTESIHFIDDFSTVGLFLVGVYGILPLIFSFGLWIQKRWAWILTFVLGISEIVWIFTEVVIFYDFEFFIFYPIIAGLGAITLGLCFAPSVRRFSSFSNLERG